MELTSTDSLGGESLLSFARLLIIAALFEFKHRNTAPSQIWRLISIATGTQVVPLYSSEKNIPARRQNSAQHTQA